MNRGWLKNGNLGGDLAKAARCLAKNRRGMPCQCPAMSNGRCRLHGGKSTGAKTAAGNRTAGGGGNEARAVPQGGERGPRRIRGFVACLVAARRMRSIP